MAYVDTTGRTNQIGHHRPDYTRTMKENHYYVGVDIGGTASRWVAMSSNEVLAIDFTGTQLEPLTGELPALSGNWLARDSGVIEFTNWANQFAQNLRQKTISSIAICFGMTGIGPRAAQAERIFQQSLQTAGVRILGLSVMSDIELAARSQFFRERGFLIYAGTGAVGAFIDDRDPDTYAFKLVGGHGVLLDDAGGGYWIAIQALRWLWRTEDSAPGLGLTSILGQSLANHLGSVSRTDHTGFVSHASRGEIASLGFAVAEAAELKDAQAQSILESAGLELARLANILDDQFSVDRPLTLAIGGRVFEHPLVINGFVQGLVMKRKTSELQRQKYPAHWGGAKLAHQRFS